MIDQKSETHIRSQEERDVAVQYLRGLANRLERSHDVPVAIEYAWDRPLRSLEDGTPVHDGNLTYHFQVAFDMDGKPSR